MRAQGALGVISPASKRSRTTAARRARTGDGPVDFGALGRVVEPMGNRMAHPSWKVVLDI